MILYLLIDLISLKLFLKLIFLMSDRELGEKIGNFGLYPASILMYLHDCDRRPPNCKFYYTCTCLYIVLRKCGVLLVVASYMQVSLNL